MNMLQKSSSRTYFYGLCGGDCCHLHRTFLRWYLQLISFGPIQSGISKRSVSCLFTPAAVPGLFIGYLLVQFIVRRRSIDIILGVWLRSLGPWAPGCLRKKQVGGLPSAADPGKHNCYPMGVTFAYGSEDMICMQW